MIVIGLSGDFRHGKSYVAKYILEAADLANLSAEIISFATPLKELCRREFGWDGVKDERGRRLLQVVGTEGARAYNPDIWVRKWLKRMHALRSIINNGVDVVIADDMRFGNELDAILSLGGFSLKVLRENADGSLYREPGMEHLYSHPSETGLECSQILRCRSGNLDWLKGYAFAFLTECTRLG